MLKVNEMKTMATYIHGRNPNKSEGDFCACMTKTARTGWINYCV
jgi:hypothetical protein